MAKTPDRVGDKPDPDISDDDLLRLYAKSAGQAPPDTKPGIVVPEDAQLIDLYMRPEEAKPAPTGHAGLLANAPDDGLLASTAKNLGTAVVKGVGDAASGVRNAGSLVDYLLARGEAKLTGKPYEEVAARHAAQLEANRKDREGNALGRLVNATAPEAVLPTAASIQNKLLGATGEYVPESMVGQMAQTGLRAVTGSLGPGVTGSATPAGNLLTGVGNVASNTARNALTLAPAAAIGDQVAQATGDPLLGMAAGIAVPGGYAAAKGGVNKLIGTVSPGTAALANTARTKYGIPITGADMAETSFGQYLNSVIKDLPFSGAAKTDAAQRGALMRGVAKTFGEDADAVTPDVMARARDRIGDKLDEIAARTRTIDARQLPIAIRDVVRKASMTVTHDELVPAIRQAANVIGMVDPETGIMTGAQYQALTKRGAPLDVAMRSKNPNISDVAHDLREAVDNAMQRSAPAGVTQDLRQARSEWKNLRTVEGLAAKSEDGVFSPALLRGAVNANNKGTYGTAYGGGGDLKELADIGRRFMTGPPQSGTSPRVTVNDLLAGIGGSYLDPKLMALSIARPVGKSLAGAVAGKAMRSDAYTNSLITRSLGPNTPVANRLLQISRQPLALPPP